MYERLAKHVKSTTEPEKWAEWQTEINAVSTCIISITKMCDVMRKPTFCMCQNKGADHHFCFGYIDSTMSLLSKSKISSLLPSSVLVQLGLCWTWSETTMLVFSYQASCHHLYLYSLVCVGPGRKPQCWFSRIKPLAIICTCTTWFVLDLVGNHNVGFLVSQLRYAYRYSVIL